MSIYAEYVSVAQRWHCKLAFLWSFRKGSKVHFGRMEYARLGKGVMNQETLYTHTIIF